MNDRSLSTSREQHLVSTRAGEVAVDETAAVGDGPTVVLLPSGGHSRHDWDGVRAGIAAEFRTVALDWPGHGDSPLPAPGWASTSDRFADVVEDVVDAVTDGPVVLMGNSVGGFAAARFALRRPGGTRGLVLVDSGGFIPLTPKVRIFDAVMGRPWPLRRIYPRFARWYMRADTPAASEAERSAVAIATDPRVAPLLSALWASFSAAGSDLRAQAGRIAAPTLVIWGRRDPVIPVRLGRELAAVVPDARMLELDTGHVPFASRPAEFLAGVLPFLRSAAGAER